MPPESSNQRESTVTWNLLFSVIVCVCVCVFVCLCVCEGELTFGDGGDSPQTPLPPVGQTKLGHKIHQNHNRLNTKMYYKSVIIHKNRTFPYFQNKT